VKLNFAQIQDGAEKFQIEILKLSLFWNALNGEP